MIAAKPLSSFMRKMPDLGLRFDLEVDSTYSGVLF